jgi:hypothetical protein
MLTLRAAETAADAVTARWRGRHLVRLEVQPLSQTAAMSWAEAALGGPVDRSRPGPARVDATMVEYVVIDRHNRPLQVR